MGQTISAAPMPRTDSPKIIVIGARCARQGIGAFVAGWFSRLGAEVCAIVGTNEQTVSQAQADLRESFRINARGYTALDDCLQAEAADVVAICSPNAFHAEHLVAVADAGLHCLCEKPLHWPGGPQGDHADGARPTTADLIDGFARRGLLLETITQWPLTLPAFYAIHQAERDAPVERFEMGLSPISTGAAMIPDAGPHFVSMLRALCGDGAIESPLLDRPSPASDSASGLANADGVTGLRISCRYRQEGGSTEAVLHVATCPERPRPAWYAINGSRVDRQVDLRAYDQSFVAGERRVPLRDPLEQLVARFLERIQARRRDQAGGQTDSTALRRDQENVERLFDVVLDEAAEPSR